MRKITICAFLAAVASAHMQLSNPYPIRSPLNPSNDEDKKDYSYTNPLDASGSNFPCKGYQNDLFVSVATYIAGRQYSMSLNGTATHDGGSCQISLSYDTGKTFTVIQSMEGGCPLTSDYTFTIPADAPSGQALFAWSWFNKMGNREMYMNCAQVTIEEDSSNGSRARDTMVSRAMTPFSSRPPMFVANVNGPGGCTTIEGQEVNFPAPGPDVVGHVTGSGYTCIGSANILSDGSSSPSSGSSSRPNTVLPTISSAAPKADSSIGGKACHSNGTIVCSSDGSTWSMCNQGMLTYMGSVAAGSTCLNGTIRDS